MPKLRSETAVEAKLGTEPANIEYQYQFIGNYTQSCSCQHLHPGISKSVRNACFQVIVPSLGDFVQQLRLLVQGHGLHSAVFICRRSSRFHATGLD